MALTPAISTPCVEEALLHNGDAVGGQTLRAYRQGEPYRHPLLPVLLLKGGDSFHTALAGDSIGEGRTFDIQIESGRFVTVDNGPVLYPASAVWKLSVGYGEEWIRYGSPCR